MTQGPASPSPTSRLYVSAELSPEPVGWEGEVQAIRSLGELEDALEPHGPLDPGVLLLTSGLIRNPDGTAELGSLPGPLAVVALGREAAEAARSAGRLFCELPESPSDETLEPVLRAAARHSRTLREATRARELRERTDRELRELNRIGMALMSERDPDRLLGMILTQARRLTTSDAGSLYLAEEAEDGTERLHFLRAQNDSLADIPTPDFTLPLDRTSIAGYAASTGEPLVIEDAYRIPEEASYTFNRGFDEEYGYRAKSMLVVPMKDHKDRVVGVLQLINRKRDPGASIRGDEDAERWVLPYGEREVELVQSLAGQAAVSIENGRLYRAIENLFRGFIEAAVIAIDQRDPTTSGHSVRVTELTCDLAEVVHRTGEGRYADVRFSDEEMKQLRYAGLLHDFGKVGVPEEVLVKMKKLPPALQERVEGRFPLIRAVHRARFYRDLVRRLEEDGLEGFDDYRARMEERLTEELERVERYREAILDANEPRPLPEDGAEILEEIAEATVPDLDGGEIPFLTEREHHFLQIRRGSLDEEEMRQIQSHVIHSYEFLQEIPWTEELSRIDEIVRGHHEKLDGSGYPRGIAAEEIPLETRMMTVADIFDALTASDRPYKKAMPVSRALEILQMEADEGKLDPELVRLFAESEVYEKVIGVDWREL